MYTPYPYSARGRHGGSRGAGHGRMRSTSTPADAVNALLAKQGKPAAPDPAVAAADRSIPGPGGALPVRVYTPKGGAAHSR